MTFSNIFSNIMRARIAARLIELRLGKLLYLSYHIHITVLIYHFIWLWSQLNGKGIEIHCTLIIWGLHNNNTLKFRNIPLIVGVSINQSIYHAGS